jgi:hypothetical protein
VKVFQPGDKIVVIKANADNPDPGSARSRNRRPQVTDTAVLGDRSSLPPS